MNKRIVCTSYFHTEGKSHNLGKHLDKDAVYSRCCAVFFDSVKKYHDFDLLLFTNKEINDEKGILLKLGVKQIILTDCRYVTDTSVSNSFPGCLYKLDVIDYLAGQDFSSVYFFDNDCFFQNDIYPIVEVVEQGFFSSIKMNYETDLDINGYNIKWMSDITGIPVDSFVYLGGEFIAFDKENCVRLSKAISIIWNYLMLTRFKKIYVDEHIVSMAANLIGKFYFKDMFIKRHWTSDVFSNTDGTEPLYSVLHLPAEKDKFFNDKYNLL